MTERLFVYGTLHPDHAPREVADLVRSFVHVGKATVRGHRYDLGDYPAVILDQKAGSIHGQVYAVPREPGALARLDAYEDYRPSDLGKSLFLRKKIEVTFEDGSKSDCWIYVYNQPIPASARTSDLASVA